MKIVFASFMFAACVQFIGLDIDSFMFWMVILIGIVSYENVENEIEEG